MNSAIVEFPDRVMAWLKNQNDTDGSPIHEGYSVVHSSEKMPNPVKKDVVRATLPGLVGVYQNWEQVEIAENSSCDQLAARHTMHLLSLRQLMREDKPGIKIRALTAKLVSLFIQHRPHLPVRDPTDPTDPTKFLWRPEDRQSTGFSLYSLTVNRANLMDPLPGPAEGLLIERSVVEISAIGLCRPI